MLSLRYRKSLRAALVVILAPWMAGACGNIVNGGYACTTDFRYGINATALDATTNANITSGAFLIVREGSYRDSVSANPGGQLAAAGERAGTYTVTIGHPGYASFTQTNVVVNPDECHVIPVKLEAKLLRNP